MSTVGQLYARLWGLLSRRQQMGFLVVLMVAVINSLLEVALVALTAVFGSALISPASFLGRDRLVAMLQALGRPPANSMDLILSAGVFTLMGLALRGLLGMLRTWFDARYTSGCYRSVACRAFARVLSQDFLWHGRQNSAVLIKLLHEDLNAIQQLLVHGLALGSDLLTVAFILAALLWKAGWQALGIFLALGILGLSVHRVTHRMLKRVSAEDHAFSRQAIVTISHSLQGIREAKVSLREPMLLGEFERLRRRMERLRADSEVLRAAPRYLMELLGIGALVLVLATLNGSEALVSTFTVLAVGFIRLLPAVNRILISLGGISNNLAPAEASLGVFELDPNQGYAAPAGERTSIESLELRNVSFSYGEGEALAGISLRLERGQSLGLVGASGGGKSTLTDIFSGLVLPTAGAVLANGTPLAGALYRSFPGRIGYVMQTPFLFDGTLAQNVAFRFEGVDAQRVWSCLRVAQLEEFVRELPEGLETRIGERGVRLSGGQAQRLAIARSIYDNPDVLILDEATSALDGPTEGAFMQALEGLRDRILIIVAHRLSTVRGCDQILVLRAGRQAGLGTHEELLRSCADYAELAKVLASS